MKNKEQQIEDIEKDETQNRRLRAHGREVTVKRSDKKYTIRVRYIEVTEEERRIKRAIIEDIMKENYKK